MTAADDNSVIIATDNTRVTSEPGDLAGDYRYAVEHSQVIAGE